MSDDYKLQASVKLYGGNVMLNIRADSPEEFAKELGWLRTNAQTITDAVKSFGATAQESGAASGGTQQSSGATAASDDPWAASPSGEAAYNSDRPHCEHDGVTRNKVFKKGKKNNKEWKAWMCWLPQERKTEQCDPEWAN